MGVNSVLSNRCSSLFRLGKVWASSAAPRDALELDGEASPSSYLHPPALTQLTATLCPYSREGTESIANSTAGKCLWGFFLRQPIGPNPPLHLLPPAVKLFALSDAQEHFARGLFRPNFSDLGYLKVIPDRNE